MPSYRITVSMDMEAANEAEAVAIFSEDVSTDGQEIWTEQATRTVEVLPELVCDCGGTVFHVRAHVRTLAVVVIDGAEMIDRDGPPDEVLVDRAQPDASVTEWGAVTCVSCGREMTDEYKGHVMATHVVENHSTPWRVIENYTSF